MGLGLDDPIGSMDAAQVAVLDLQNRGIVHTTGLEHFIGLTHLNLSNNPLAHIDVSRNVALTHLGIAGTCLDTLNLNSNTALQWLDVSRNHFTGLNLQANRSLQQVNATHNFFENQAAIRLPTVVMTLHFNPQNSHIVTPPTCTTGGFVTWTCGNDPTHTHISNETPPLGHLFTSVVTRPTFTQAGFTTHTCTRCGYSFVDSRVPAIALEYAPTLSLRYNQATSVFADVARRAPDLTWHSSNTDALRIDQNGMVSYARMGRGTTIVTATCADGIERMRVTVTVSIAWWQWMIIIFFLGFLWY